jgi:hypothetical protein
MTDIDSYPQNLEYSAPDKLPAPTHNKHNAHDAAPRLQFSADGCLEPEQGQDEMEINQKLSRMAGETTPEEGQALLRQLISACGLQESKDIDSINAAVSQLYHMRPADPLEACTLVQLLGSHYLSMKYMKQAQALGSFDSGEKKAALAVRFSNAYTKQLDALCKYQRGSTQQIQVNHVHMEGDAQAIIGEVKSK